VSTPRGKQRRPAAPIAAVLGVLWGFGDLLKIRLANESASHSDRRNRSDTRAHHRLQRLHRAADAVFIPVVLKACSANDPWNGMAS
jgi:hypothetical protein